MTSRSLLLCIALSTLVITPARVMAGQEDCLVTITATLTTQASQKPSGANFSLPASTKVAVNTKSILARIAQVCAQQQAPFNYTGPVPFPAGTKLIIRQSVGQVPGTVGSTLTAPYYLVVDKNNVPISGTGLVSSMVKSGQTMDFSAIGTGTRTSTYVAAPKMTFYNTDTFTFLDNPTSPFLSIMRFTMSGAFTETWSNGPVNHITGLHKETQSVKVTGAVGRSSYIGGAALMAGSYSYAGSANVQ